MSRYAEPGQSAEYARAAALRYLDDVTETMGHGNSELSAEVDAGIAIMFDTLDTLSSKTVTLRDARRFVASLPRVSRGA